MLSLIEVKCPHCGAEGQILLPPLGALIVGPCPECNEMVVVFCGKVLALDKAIMDGENLEAKKAHLLSVLQQFLHERVDRLFEEASASKPDAAAPPAAVPPHAEAQAKPMPRMKPATGKDRPISTDEFESFVNIDLRLLDNRDYFKSVFG